MTKTPQRKLDANRRYRERNREAILYHKRNNRLRRFGLEPEDLTRMLENQKYECMLCGSGPLLREGRQNLSAHIDHCHTCGDVRGLLCKRCNTLVGFLESSDCRVLCKALEFCVNHDFDNHGKREAA